jgi:hypothetical protein
MDLTLGSHVREHGHRVGRVAGFELEPATLNIRRIIFSPDGSLGPQAMTRPLNGVTATSSGIELRPDADIAPLPAVADVALLSRSTRLTRDGRDRGRLVGIGVDLDSRRLLSVSGRQHWFSPKFTAAAAQLDCSQPGEIRIARGAHDSRAA